MTYFDDPTTPAAPFSGDQSGLDYPDVLLQSPTTTERVVDTQSGFLLVVKRMGERLALSCKRRVGTPPSSAIMLTPDESVKLSKILSHSITGLEDSLIEDEAAPRVPTTAIGGRRRIPFKVGSSAKTPSFLKQYALPLQIGGAVVVIAALCGGTFYAGKLAGEGTKPGVVAVDPLSTENVDKFSKRFVAEMLDFNPDTYKQSQIQAMSVMAPELIDKYWAETNFPLSKRQLKQSPQGMTVMITRIGQERTSPTEATSDIYAQLVKPETKLSSPVHIKLKLGVGDENSIRVLDQEDLTAGAHQ